MTDDFPPPQLGQRPYLSQKNSHRDSSPSYGRKPIHGYGPAGFVGDGGEEGGRGQLPFRNSYGFMPVTDRYQVASSMRGAAIGRPIRGDPELANLSKYERGVLFRFMDEAKKSRLSIMQRRGRGCNGPVLGVRQTRAAGIKIPIGMS